MDIHLIVGIIGLELLNLAVQWFLNSLRLSDVYMHNLTTISSDKDPKEQNSVKF